MTPPCREWRLLRDELEFAAAYTKSIPLAKKLLLRHLGQVHSGIEIRWICFELELEGDWTIVAAHRFFWHPNSGHIETDWDMSSATRSGPPAVISGYNPSKVVEVEGWPFERKEDIPAALRIDEDAHPIFLMWRPRTVLKASVIRLCHDDVVAMLRAIGLLPPEPVPVEGGAQVPNPKSPPKAKLGSLAPRLNETAAQWIARIDKERPQTTEETDHAYRQVLIKLAGPKWAPATVRNYLNIYRKKARDQR